MVSIKKIVFGLLLCCVASMHAAFAQKVYVQYNSSTPQAAYASDQLKEALLAQKYTVLEDQKGYDYVIRIGVDTASLESEAYVIIPGQNSISISGGDNRGMIYGSLSLAESLQHGTRLQEVQKQNEKPHYPFRAIKHNTPWYSYRPSSALDQHYETVRDVRYWEAFLDMMAENRFNSLSLWNLHPFVYMINPKNFPEASPFSEAEMKEWQQLHREIFRMADERAIDTYIIPFNIFVSPEFAEAYGVAQKNVYPHYYVQGDTSEIVKRYMRESITQLLQEYPTLTGMGLTLGEGMAGMTPQQREDWIYDTYIEGMRQVGRPLKLVHRIPFSSTTESLGATSVELERLTRKSIEREANLDFIQEPIWADLKYNWSHAHSTPKLVKVHGGEMFDTFYNPMPEGYKITYTARNEDFFALRWGVPDFIRAHIALNSQPYVGGYFIGSETYIPAKDYFTAVDAPVYWQWAFERQWLFYKLWGRLLYNPATPDEVFQAEFTRRYGKKGKNLLQAYSLASSTQLRLASLYDSRWDFTLYGEGFMALIGDSTQYISVDALINQPPLDPDYVSVKDFVQKKLTGGSFGKDRITPPVLIKMLERDSRKALRLVEDIDTRNNASLMYEVADVKTWANLGLHLAEKLKGAVALQTYRIKGGKGNQQKAVAHLQKALGYWDKVIQITRPIYKDMPLTHYNGSSHDRNDNNLFHWALIRPEVARDIDLAKQATVQGIK
ncbi:glycoside hydrolase family 20 zincin-like fold domain-containing protein [Pontibacter pamirensis]|uniref:glycoside hydrolase family 20 zincin-like fold domain-containing protein n=1 Tax=Pontibacter pamirensis TaxID=2562824 RepID=UPI001389D328|nr:glycoside hydrolase family 20 zincin-like fold domain-containing protein [Pontibacter pamirensis]